MTLSEYLKTMDKEGLDGLARRCGTSVGQLKQVAYGNRRASAGLAVNLDRETGGKILCESLRPDIDWGYLRQGKH
ncbi:TPA: helix-turn-helix domain-containing protein [Pseudomonas putida]|uniref:transcriptional regulator n=1 Tax=Pseudomonas putida TaxID=303 RepID=UPI0023639BDC|nr:YdaS family helix-turn-helix protein [Pseudomonas putida]MDD2150760.1 helix-turn-helix domain-containing protein [Pseudomonas putida]HDS1679172.1 helix-turn-helix domain-containing protein [Pseudomonas putida]